MMRKVRTRVLVVLLCCYLASCGSPINRNDAKALADGFIADLTKDDLKSALGRMEPEFLRQIGDVDIEARMRSLFEFCGRPLDSELQRDEIGAKLYPDGRRKPLRKFFYTTTTTKHPKGVCFFSVEVVPEGEGLAVTSFGPLRFAIGKPR